jgi:tetratricopeptide (TPR) repeat protein
MSPRVLYCNRCGEENPLGSRFCEVCGDPFEQNICACGAELVPKARFCHMCGVPVAASTPAAEAAILRPPNLALSLREKHAALLGVHAKAAAALEEARKLQPFVSEAHARANAHREQAQTAQVHGENDAAQAHLAQQIGAEQEAAAYRARWELAEAACAPLREQLSALHAEFLAAVDVALNDFSASREWSTAVETFSTLASAEVSRSRRARLLYAQGIVARDGLGDLKQAQSAFEAALAADPRNQDAKGALETVRS